VLSRDHRERSASVPELPTVSEAGVPGFEAITCTAWSCPRPRPGRWSKAQCRHCQGAAYARSARAAESLAQKLAPGTPQDFADTSRARSRKWAKV